MNITGKLVAAGFMSILTIATGFFMSRGGKPYGAILFTVHKLAALSVVVFAVMVLLSHVRRSGITSGLLLFLISGGVSLITLFASGAIMSIGRQPVPALPAVHAVATVVAIVCAAATVLILTPRT